METNRKKLISVLAVMIMVLAAFGCTLAQPSSSGDGKSGNPVYFEVRDNNPSQPFLNAINATHWEPATSDNGWTAKMTIENADYTNTGTSEYAALEFYCIDDGLTEDVNIKLEITLVGDNTIVSTKDNRIGILIDKYTSTHCKSIDTKFKGTGTLNTNGMRITGNLELEGGCRINSLCKTEVSHPGAWTVGVMVTEDLNYLSGFNKKTITVGSGCTLNAMAENSGSENVVGACAGNIVIDGGKANFIATKTGTNNHGLYSDTAISVTLTNSAAMSAFAITSGKNSYALYANSGDVTLNVTQSILYAYGTDAGVKCKSGNLIFSTCDTADVGIYGDTKAADLTGTIQGDMTVTGHYYESYPATPTIKDFSKPSDLKGTEMGAQMVTNKVILEIPETLYNSIDIGFNIGFEKLTGSPSTYTLKNPQIKVEGKIFDQWWVNDDLHRNSATKKVGNSYTLSESGFYWTVSTWKLATVTYQVDGTTWKTETTKTGSYSVTSDTPTKSGYTFKDWDMDGTPVQSGATIQVTGDVTLVAEWDVAPTPTTYTVTYKVDGKAWKTATTESGSYTLISDKPTKDGYDFTGWKYNGSIVQPGEKITVTGNTTLEAQWEKHTDPQPSSGNDNTAIIIGVVAVLVIAVGAGAFFYFRRP